MNIFSYHLVEIPFTLAIKGLFANPIDKKTKGIVHFEYMTAMTLGSPIISASRFLINQVVVFAQWENESSLNDFLENMQWRI
mgnify:CR=1 FL=1